MVGMLKALLVQNFSGTQARMKGYYRLRKEPQTAWWCHGSAKSRVIQAVVYDDRFAVVWKILRLAQSKNMGSGETTEWYDSTECFRKSVQLVGK